MPKASFTPPMKAGDSTLMMLLSLNLLLLVFFMMLNSMATYGAKHAQDVLTKVREGYSVPSTNGAMRGGVNVPEVPQAAWQTGIISHLQGVVMNRIELRVPPQVGSAGKVEMELPLAQIFNTQGKLVKPEFIRNMVAAAGVESRIEWQVRGHFENAERLAPYVASLAREVGVAELVESENEGLHLIISPGFTTKPNMGLQVQQVGEDAGAKVNGVDESLGE